MKNKPDYRKDNNRRFHIEWICTAFIVLIACLLWAAVLPHIDDVTHNELSEKDVLKTESIRDSDSPYDHCDGSKLIVERGEGMKVFSGPLDLKDSDAIKVSFTAVNNTDKGARIYVDLYADNFDDPFNEFRIKVPAGKEEKVSREIAFYRDEHPDVCSLRIYTKSDTSLEIRDVEVDYLRAVKNENKGILKAVRIMQGLLILALVFILAYSIYGIKRYHRRSGRNTSEIKKEIISYAVIVLAVTLTLAFLYRNADLKYPLIFNGGDETGVLYYAKNIDQNGISLANPYAGGVSGADMFDYPYSDSLSFFMVKAIGLFTDDPYLIINLFYFLNFYIIAIVAFSVARKLGLSRINSDLAGMLYAFSPYIQMRYPHMWLVPYFMIPVACLLSVNIIKGRIPSEADAEKRKTLFWTGVMLSFFCAFTGMYYAYFACALFAVAMVIRMINVQGKDIRKELYPLAYITSTIIGVVINVVPNLIYWNINGTNPYSEISSRNRGDAEAFALKLVQMILPRPGHRIGFFAWINEGYNQHYPLINENVTASLGIIASIGFLVSLLLLFSEKNRYKEISWINLSAFIIATVGGIGSIISVAVPIPMRSYNRFSIVIMFLSLLLVGMVLDRIQDRLPVLPAVCISLAVLAFGLFDQTVDYHPYDTSSLDDSRQFLSRVRDASDEGDMIFILPYTNWPNSGVTGAYGKYICYLETDDLIWSYGAMQGREEALWQKHAAGCEPQEMIKKLQYAGYEGIYLDAELYEQKYDRERTEQDIISITQAAGTEPIVSGDRTKYFWSLRGTE